MSTERLKAHLVALILLGVLLGFAAVFLRLVYPAPVESWVVLAASAASIVAYFVGLLPFTRQVLESWRAAHDFTKRDRLKRRVVIACYSTLFLLSVFLAGIFVVDLAQLLLTGALRVDWRATLWMHRLAAPGLVAVLSLALLFKLRTSTMLDRQKQGLVALLGPLDDPKILGTATPLLMRSRQTRSVPGSHPPAKRLLEHICERATSAATRVGLRISPPRASVIAGFFLADVTQKTFIPIASFGGTAAYETAMETFRPPFLDFQGFKGLYESFAIKTARDPKSDLTSMFESFRLASRGLVSNCGMVYALERTFAFGPNLMGRCVAHRFEFLQAIPEAERPRYWFEQSVGIPISVLGRKVGVLLLLSNRYGTFYPHDRSLFLALGGFASLAVRNLFQSGAIEEWIPGGEWEAYPVLGENEAQRREIAEFVDSITDNFTWKKARKSHGSSN